MDGRQAQSQKRAGWAVAALLLANLALAMGPLFVRLSDTGPVASAFWRMALALPFIALLARGTGAPLRIPLHLGGVILLAGLFFAADLGSWHVGILQTKLANATLLGNMASILYPVYGFIAARALPSRMQGLALVFGAAGAVLLMGRSYDLSPRNFQGDLLCLAAGIFYTFYLVGIERARGILPQGSVLFWSTLSSALPLLAAAWWLGEQIIPRDWTPLVALALGSQIIGQGLLILSLGRLPPLLIGIAFLTQPIAAAVIGWSLFGEALALADWIGAALVGLALVLVRQPHRSREDQ